MKARSPIKYQLRKGSSLLLQLVLPVVLIPIPILLFIAAERSHKPICQRMQVHIDHSRHAFVDTPEVQELLRMHHTEAIIGQPVHQLNLEMLEHALVQHPFIRDAQVYTNIPGDLTVVIHQREPLLRVINNNYVDYYIDRKGFRMPLNPKFTARVPVVNGHIEDPDYQSDTIRDPVIQDVYRLGYRLSEDPLWRTQVMQIYVRAEREFELVPRMGSHTVLLGDLDRLEQKLDKLRRFYATAMQTGEWNKYRMINLKFENQIVCKKH